MRPERMMGGPMPRTGRTYKRRAHESDGKVMRRITARENADEKRDRITLECGHEKWGRVSFSSGVGRWVECVECIHG